MRALILVAVAALAGCAAARTVRDVEDGAEAIELACTEALPLAQMAALIPGAVVVVQGVAIGCATADGFARLAAEPTSAAWLGAQTQMLRDLIARTKTDLRGIVAIPRIPGA